MRMVIGHGVHHHKMTKQSTHLMLQQLHPAKALARRFRAPTPYSVTSRACCSLTRASQGSAQETEQGTPGASPSQPHLTDQQHLQQQWYQQSSVYYSNYPLNRAAEQRRDEAQLSSWFTAPNARAALVLGSKVLLSKTQPSSSSSSSNAASASSANSSCDMPPSFKPVWVLPAAELGAVISPAVPPLFLGLDASSTPHFAVQVTAEAAQQLVQQHGAHWVSARVAGPDLSRSDAALMAVASGLAQWNLDSQYHGGSGAQTLPQDGGFSRRCSSSGRSLYPRIDPAIITLVTCGRDWCLLGRKAGWPPGRFSTLAGFLELGESLEQALCREVLEEAGVVVELSSIRYEASQPWPFPKSLMVGFYAAAPLAAAAAAAGSRGGTSAAAAAAAGGGGGVEWLSPEGRMAMMDTGLKPSEVADAVSGLRLQRPTPQQDEMEEVVWCHRDWLSWALQRGAAAAPGNFHVPGAYSLAYRLITGWLGTSSSSSSNGAGSVDSSTSSSHSSSTSWTGDQVPQVDIDAGVFKYVLLRLTDSSDSSRSKLLVRGSAAAAYHNHILQHTKAQLQQLAPGQLQVQVLGGGRIEHYPEQQVAAVYGYSAAFGPAVHEVTAGLLKKWHPFTHVTWSYEGY